MSSVNICTVNGEKHNGHLQTHYQQIQNRSAAVLHVYGEADNISPVI